MNLPYLSDLALWQKEKFGLLEHFGKCDIFPVHVSCDVNSGFGTGGKRNQMSPICLFDSGRNHRVMKIA